MDRPCRIRQGGEPAGIPPYTSSWPPRVITAPDPDPHGVVSSPSVDPHRHADVESSNAGGTRRRRALVAGLLCLVAFALLTWNAVGEIGLARVDPDVQDLVVRHRVGLLTDAFRALTWLGSTTVLALVLVAVGAFLLITRRDVVGAILPATALAVTIVAKNEAKMLIGRPRPSPEWAIGSNTGFAFPSGHAADSLAAYAMLVLILSTGRSLHARWAIRFAAAGVVLVVGASRVYLGAHWFTDVLGGWALAGAIVAILTWAFPRKTPRLDPSLKPPGGPART